MTKVEEDPSGSDYVTQYAYDALDDITTVTQGSQTRSFVFNMRGWQTSATNPEQSAPTYLSYDNNGNVVYRQDPRGIETCYQYDSVNRLTLQVYFTGAEAGSCAATANNTSGPYTPNVSYSYDTGIGGAHGRLVSVSNGTIIDGITGYDELGRIQGNSQTVGGLGPQSVYYYYDKADEVYQEIYPTGRAVNNSFDVAGRMTSVTGVLGSASTPYAMASCAGGGCNPYAPSGMPNGLTYANGVTRAFTYNNRLQPYTITDTHSGSTLFGLTYTFGTATTNNGNPTQVAISGAGGSFTQTYGYDHMNRLTGFTDSGGASQALAYDRYGNMWQPAQTGLGSVPALAALPTSSSEINAANNQLTSATGVTYDGTDGNQTTFLGVQMYYDAENRLIQSTNTVSGNTYFYSYDGLGQRVTKALGGGATTYYLHDVSGSVVVEYNSQTSALCSTCYLSQDHLGSTRMVTDGSGSIVARHDYLPFGVEIPNGVAGRGTTWSVTDGLSPKFTGQDRDPEVLLDYFYARNLANGLGRFMSPDPLNAGADASDPQTWNMYGYVGNRPLVAVDPDGLDETALDCIDDPELCEASDWGGGIWAGPILPGPEPGTWGEGNGSGSGGGVNAGSAGWGTSIPGVGIPVPWSGVPAWPGSGVVNGFKDKQALAPPVVAPAAQPGVLRTLVDLFASILSSVSKPGILLIATPTMTQQDEIIWLKTGKLPIHNAGPSDPRRLDPSWYKKPLSEHCQRVKDACIDKCSELLPLPRTDQGTAFYRCLNACMEDAGCR